MRDVTVLLRVDPNRDDTDTVAAAAARVNAGLPATVNTDDQATSVLVALGLSAEDAADQVRVSHGPMA